MELQPARQLDYLQRTLSIFLAKSSDMTEQFESLIDELIKENKQITKPTKLSPETSSSESKSDTLTNANSPQALPKKRSAPLAANSKPPPNKKMKSSIPAKDEEDINNNNSSNNSNNNNAKRKKIELEETSTSNEKDDDNDDDDDDGSDDSKSKPSESQVNPSSSRGIDEFAFELGLVCTKCMVLTEDTDNKLVECHECHTRYHQKCHKPPVSTADISDPRFLWYCSKCRRLIAKRQTQSSIKETKSNSNPSSSVNKSKPNDSSAISVKKCIPNSITDVTSGLFSFKAKTSDSNTADTNSISHPTLSSSNSSVSNGSNNVKHANGWASLATGFKGKKATESTSGTSLSSGNTSSSSILSELTALTSTSGNNTNETKRSPPSPKSLATIPTPTTNSLPKLLTNGTGLGSLKSSGTSLSSIKQNKPSSPPVLKPQTSATQLKQISKPIPTAKSMQRVSSPTPLGRPNPPVKSPSTTGAPTYQRLNSSGSNSPGNNSSTPTTTGTFANHSKIITGQDYDKRIKQMKKLAAEKSLTKKS